MIVVLILYVISILVSLYYLDSASMRLSSLLIQEEGPFNILLNLRNWLGVKETWEDDEELGFFHKLLTCIYCLSVWVSTFLTVLCFCGPFSLIVIGLGSSQKVIEEYDRKNNS